MGTHLWNEINSLTDCQTIFYSIVQKAKQGPWKNETKNNGNCQLCR